MASPKAISCHAVAGTSALVSVDSSRAVAIRLDSLVHDLGGALRALLDRHQQLARLREACDAGVDALRAVIWPEQPAESTNEATPIAATVETATVLFNLVGWTDIHLRTGHGGKPERALRATLDPVLHGLLAA